MGERRVAGLRVGIDGYNLAMPHGTGIATYASELVRTINALGHRADGIFGIDVPADPALRQAVFFDRYRRPSAPQTRSVGVRGLTSLVRRLVHAVGPHPAREVLLDGNIQLAPAGMGAIPPFDRLFSIARLFQDAMLLFARTGHFVTVRLPQPPEVMHWTYPIPVRLAGSTNIYTVHDLVPLKLPYTTLDNKRLYGALVNACLRRADLVCTVSEATRRDILDRFDVAADKVVNTYQTYSTADDNCVDGATIESIFGLTTRGYFLYFGAIEPKKNIGRLIEAYLALRTATPLVIVGGRLWQSESELALIPGLGDEGATGSFAGPRGQAIVRLDYLPRHLLSRLIAGAKAVVFPSLYEGFGLPVLEAMRLSTPVITSSTSSLPEVAGDAAILIDPYDVNALTEAMRRLDGDAALGLAMAAAGRMQAAFFAPDVYARRLSALYAAAIDRRARA